MIENARNRWYESCECTITSMMDYIESKGMLRDAQINAIKTYFYLKIYCESRSLVDLFCEGKFNTLDLDSAEISNTVRIYLEQNAAAAALFEYSCLKNDKGEQVSKKLEEFIKKRTGLKSQMFRKSGLLKVKMMNRLLLKQQRPQI